MPDGPNRLQMKSITEHVQLSAPRAADPDRRAHEGDSFWSRNQLSAAVLLVSTALLFYACYLMARPFLPALAWALALAIVAHPLHRWIAKRVKKPGLAATLAVVLVAVIIVAPAAFLVQTMVGKAAATLEVLQGGQIEQVIDRAAQSNPGLARIWEWIKSQGGAASALDQVTGMAGTTLKSVVGGSTWGVVTFLVAFLLLFYFWRDRGLFTEFIRHFLPLSDAETDRLFSRLKDTIHASIFGTLVVAAVQGTLGGLMFWWLGLPAPLLWGVVMGLLSVIPVLGAFVIWIPAAVFLAMQGNWGKAIILTVWGTVVVGLIDNLLYPILVGQRLRLHTVPVFLGIVGGLMVFGPSGLVLGPVIVALTDAVLNIWRCRTAQGQTADTATT
jgi:predicted PurR-regulated permease PerM